MPHRASSTRAGRQLRREGAAPLHEILACGDIERGACPFHFSILALDPESLAPRSLYENRGAPMGAGTAALRIGDELVIGSFKGDRIVRVTLAK